MTSKMTYTVPEVPGSKRQSERPYTHAVIGSYDPERVVAHLRAEHEANRARDRRWSTKHWNDEKRLAEVKAGEMYVNHNGYRVEARQGQIDIAVGFMAKHPTLEGYLAHLEAEFIDETSKSIAGGNRPLTVLRWSMSAWNAARGIGEFERHYSGIRVVRCVPVVIP